jgi:hypothetical protein
MFSLHDLAYFVESLLLHPGEILDLCGRKTRNQRENHLCWGKQLLPPLTASQFFVISACVQILPHGCRGCAGCAADNTRPTVIEGLALAMGKIDDGCTAHAAQVW